MKRNNISNGTREPRELARTGILPGLLSGLTGASVPGQMPPVPEGRLLNTLPLYSAGAEQDRMFHQQRIAIDALGTFTSAYVARGRQDGNGQRLDPVLEAHLRVAPEERK